MSAVSVLGLWLSAASAAALLAPSVDGAVGLQPIVALAAGIVVGIVLFATLARHGVLAGGYRRLPARRALARCTVLIARSAYEEAVWRGLVLGLLLPAGRAVALAASAALFAAAHAPRLGRRAATHLWTGAAFGALYLATGTLVAPIAAHAAYNVAVGLALLAAACPVRPTDASGDH